MAEISYDAIEKVAGKIGKMPENSKGLNFYSFKNGENEIVFVDMYPSLRHPQAVNYFFFTCLHQFGFWLDNEAGYREPLYGSMDGKKCKGSDLLYKAAKKAFDADNDIYIPENLALISRDELFENIFIDDNGPIPFPDAEERYKITRIYGQWFEKQKIKAEDIIAAANFNRNPLKYFLEQIKRIGGYNKDFFEKKNILLAMIMANRPEKFLKNTEDLDWPPIIDYHLMRVALRLGLVYLSEDEYEIIRNRQWAGKQMENNIRKNVYHAVVALIQKSRRTMAFVDELMWNARRYCPETEIPNCEKCIFTDVCLKKIELFQPVYRTTDY